LLDSISNRDYRSRSWLVSLPIGFGSGEMEFPNDGDALAPQHRSVTPCADGRKRYAALSAAAACHPCPT
jgi:hypothetical protein